MQTSESINNREPQTISEWWERHRAIYYTKQTILSIVEIIFMIFACSYSVSEYNCECVPDLGKDANQTMTPPIVPYAATTEPDQQKAKNTDKNNKKGITHIFHLQRALIYLILLHLGFLLTYIYKIYLFIKGKTKTVNIIQCALVDCRCCYAFFAYGYAQLSFFALSGPCKT